VALAQAVGYTLVAVPVMAQRGNHVPASFGRQSESDLLDLCASGNVDPDVWRAHGPGFFMGGVAVMLASTKGFERERYLRLAESLHPGASTPEVFEMWLQKSPIRPSRFVPLAKKRSRIA
jgi:hypothetical protein